ncbi:hypothetical protein Ndes2437B_g03885 [Nannochloris sp. 'desiccata']
MKDISIDTVAERRYPAGPSLRARLLTLFCKSITAANSSPWAMMTVSACLFGKRATPRIQQQGMEFAVWMFKHAEPAMLAPAAASVVENCLALLDSAPAAAGQDSIAISLPEATSSLAAAFQDRDSSTDEAILQLLETSITGNYGNSQQQYFPPDAVRGAAVQWAVRLFPFNHLQARYLCILGTADTRVQLASAAEEGLDPKRVAVKQQRKKISPSSGGACGVVNNAAGGGDEITNGVAANIPQSSQSQSSSSSDYPTLADMLRYLCARHPVLKSPVQEGRGLVLPATSFISAIKFFREL